MKVYQLIYTSVQHSLSDSELGLSNQPGLRVYSCSQGITKENIGEIVKFSNYRLPKNDKTEYSEIIGDPQIPSKFPKTFRTLRLADGRYAALQAVYSGVDYQGQPGNFFAHALVFDEFEEDFFPEAYFDNSAFKTYLTTEEAEKELVLYLPSMDDIKPEERVQKEIEEFIINHKKELSYLIEKALETLTSGTIKNICIATGSEEVTSKYLVALKWLLPRDISVNTGISTYNVYIPSNSQKQIIFNGTIKGKNNITKQAVETRETCLYIDMETTDFSQTEENLVLKFSLNKLREEYKKYKITSVMQFNDWLALTHDINEPGLGSRLLNLKSSGGAEAFRNKFLEIYNDIDNPSYDNVRFEVIKVAYDNIGDIPEKSAEITKRYIDICVDKLCQGESYDIVSLFDSNCDKHERAEQIKGSIPEYMQKIKAHKDETGEKNSRILLSMLAEVKHGLEISTWKELFNSDKELLTIFVELASVIITGYGMEAFTPPDTWTQTDMDEIVVYFDSSTRDEKIKDSCFKYIYNHDETDWEQYGIILTKHRKTIGEHEIDMKKIKRMLAKVGYIPYQRNKYTDLRRDVCEDMNSSRTPLLLTRVLDAYYAWTADFSNQVQSEKSAKKLRNLILELKKTQKPCYDFVIPKLALEIIESYGHYHETIIDTETVPQNFWNWFVLGFEHCDGDEDKMLNYTRIYEANKRKLLRTPYSKRLREVFKGVEQ